MKKNLISISVAAAITAPAMALSDATLYGIKKTREKVVSQTSAIRYDQPPISVSHSLEEIPNKDAEEFQAAFGWIEVDPIVKTTIGQK